MPPTPSPIRRPPAPRLPRRSRYGTAPHTPPSPYPRAPRDQLTAQPATRPATASLTALACSRPTATQPTSGRVSAACRRAVAPRAPRSRGQGAAGLHCAHRRTGPRARSAESARPAVAHRDAHADGPPPAVRTRHAAGGGTPVTRPATACCRGRRPTTTPANLRPPFHGKQVGRRVPLDHARRPVSGSLRCGERRAVPSRGARPTATRAAASRSRGPSAAPVPCLHEVEQERQSGVHLDVVEAESFEGAQLVVVSGDHPGPERSRARLHPRLFNHPAAHAGVAAGTGRPAFTVSIPLPVPLPVPPPIPMPIPASIPPPGLLVAALPPPGVPPPAAQAMDGTVVARADPSPPLPGTRRRGRPETRHGRAPNPSEAKLPRNRSRRSVGPVRRAHGHRRTSCTSGR